MNTEQYKTSLVGRKVEGVFSGKFYTGVVIESITEPRGFNHIIKLDKPIVMIYDNPTQTRANNRWVLHHVNFSTDYQEQTNSDNVLTITE
jgi:hypothetical protein